MFYICNQIYKKHRILGGVQRAIKNVCVCVHLQILFPCRLMFKQIVDNIMVVLQTNVCPDFSIGPYIISTCFLMHYEYEF